PFTDAVGIDPAFDPKLSTFYDAVAQPSTESLTDGQALGIVAAGEPPVLAHLSTGPLQALPYPAVTLGLAAESAAVLTQQIYTFLAQGYRRVGEAKPEPKPRRRGRRG